MRARPELLFDRVFSDHMVLQQSPARAAVYGTISLGAASARPTLAVVVQSASNHYVVPARLQDCAGHRCEWIAFLRPTSPVAGVHNITVEVQRPDAVLQRPVVGQQEAPLSPQLLHDIVFGDVWICAGQSNMWLPLSHTFQRQASVCATPTPSAHTARAACSPCCLSALALPF